MKTQISISFNIRVHLIHKKYCLNIYQRFYAIVGKTTDLPVVLQIVFAILQEEGKPKRVIFKDSWKVKWN